MLYLIHLKKRIEDLYKKLEGKRTLPYGEYSELCRNLNEVVREARRSRSSWLDRIPRASLPKEIASEDVLPESFLIRLFRRRIERTVRQFSKRHPDFFGRNPDTFAEEFVRTIILGDYNERDDIRREREKFLEDHEVSEEKLLKMNSLWAKAHRDALLGQKGSHKKKGYLKELRTHKKGQDEEALSRNLNWDDPWADLKHVKGDGFLIRDAAAIEASREIALRYKKRTKKNPCDDEPSGYDPDYLTPEGRQVLKEEAMVNLMAKMWEDGEFKADLPSREDLVKYLESKVIRRPIGDLKAEIGTLKKREQDLIRYIFGNRRKRGRLYRRLLEIYRFLRKKETAIRPNNIENGFDPCVKSESAQKRIEEIKKVLTQTQKHFLDAYLNALDEVSGKHVISHAAKTLGCTRENAYKHLRNIKSLLRAKKDQFSDLQNLTE